MEKQVTVIGCGVIGLTTAITLLENNYQVKIISDKLPVNTTSAIAAAVWLPFEVQPLDKVSKWSVKSYAKYQKLTEDKKSGVSMVEMTSILEAEEDAWWKNLLPPQNIRKAKFDELPADNSIGYIVQVPLIETQLHLSYLFNNFKDLGGIFEQRKINSLEEFTQTEVLINCTGLASMQLLDDQEMYPIRGQIVYLKADPTRRCIVSEIVTGELQDELAYIIPRKDYTVLGGTATKGAEDISINKQSVQGVLDRCKMLDPSIGDLTFSHSVMGLRPGRTEIRLERTKGSNTIHNYGHGGGGYTVAWGCANEVLEILLQDL